MSPMVLFFVVLFVIPAAWFLARQFEEPAKFFGIWIAAALIILMCLLMFFFRTIDEATGGDDGWGKAYKDIGEGKFE